MKPIIKVFFILSVQVFAAPAWAQGQPQIEQPDNFAGLKSVAERDFADWRKAQTRFKELSQGQSPCVPPQIKLLRSVLAEADRAYSRSYESWKTYYAARENEIQAAREYFARELSVDKMMLETIESDVKAREALVRYYEHEAEGLSQGLANTTSEAAKEASKYSLGIQQKRLAAAKLDLNTYKGAVEHRKKSKEENVENVRNNDNALIDVSSLAKTADAQHVFWESYYRSHKFGFDLQCGTAPISEMPIVWP